MTTETAIEVPAVAGVSDPLAEGLIARFADRSAVVGIVGIGRVGLRLAIEFARAGFVVHGYDTDPVVVADLNAGRIRSHQLPRHELAGLVRSGAFTAHDKVDALAPCDAICVAVPTLLSTTREPDDSRVYAAVAEIARIARPGSLLLIVSTVSPETTEVKIPNVLEEHGRFVGRDLFLAVSPERLDLGRSDIEYGATPRLLAGVTASCLAVATALLSTCFGTVRAVRMPIVAEVAKLLENTYRAVNIALVNEFAIICDLLHVDVWEVMEAAATKPFGFAPFSPGPGIGGHCIPVDPHYLAWKTRAHRHFARFIDLASEINSAMPRFVLERVVCALNDRQRSVNGSRILVVGVAYKAGADDATDSPARDLIRLLVDRRAEVVYHDPFVPTLHEEKARESVPLTADELHAADLVLIATDHSASVVDYDLIVRESALIVDARNVTRNAVRAARRRVAIDPTLRMATVVRL